MSRTRSKQSKSKSQEEERQREDELISPEQFKSVPFDYSKYLSEHKSPVLTNIDYEQPIRDAEKRNYEDIESNNWNSAPLYPPIRKMKSNEKSPSKKRKRVLSAKKRRGTSKTGGKRHTKKNARK